MEQIIFIVIVAVVGLLRLIAQAAENRKNAQAEKEAGAPTAQPSTTPQPPPAQTEEERIRKFFEALGVPTAQSPPPKVQPRQAAPKAPPAKRTIPPIDPFPMPRGRVEPSRPPVATATPPPLVLPAPPPIPTPPVPAPMPPRETTVLARSLREKTASLTNAADFEVQVIGGTSAEDFIPASGAATPGQDQPANARESLAARLATEQGMRDAMVLQEIFGRPRSMQPWIRQTVG